MKLRYPFGIPSENLAQRQRKGSAKVAESYGDPMVEVLQGYCKGIGIVREQCVNSASIVREQCVEDKDKLKNNKKENT